MPRPALLACRVADGPQLRPPVAPIANPRNDRGSLQQGQGNTVSQSLPEAPRIRLRAASDALREATPARADAGVILLPAAEARAALAKLPQAALWQRLYQANRRAGPPPHLSSHPADRAGQRAR